MTKLPGQVVSRLRPAYAGRSVCVTGGAGFIGSHVVDTLHGLGARVRVLDDLSLGKLDNISELIELDPEMVRFTLGSVLDDGALADAIDGCDLVFHLAAVGSVPRSIEDPQRSWDVNATGTIRVLEAARRVGASRVLIASSSSVYGGGDGSALSEDRRTEPVSPYAASKLAAEQLGAVWARSYGIDTCSLRYFNVFGSRQRSDIKNAAVVPAFVRASLEGRAPVIYGGGERSRDFTHVDNVVAGTLLAGARESALEGLAINLACGVSTSLSDLASLVLDAAGAGGLVPEHAPARSGDVRASLADISLAQRELGYEPHVGVDDGVRMTLAACDGSAARSDKGRTR